jgi:membrane-associated phospholipid phosphatase
MTVRSTGPLGPSLSPFRFSIIAVTCLCAFAVLALAVADGSSPYGFEDPVFTWLGAPSTTATWANLAELLATPAICVALVISVVLGMARRGLPRVVVYAAIAGTAFVISEHVAKPLVQRSYYGELTFPSGSVTAVCATTLAMCLALYPLLGKRARVVQFVISGAWTLLMALAVVGALWHTPLDDLGSILLSIGIVSGGAAVFEHVASRRTRSRNGCAKVGR